MEDPHAEYRKQIERAYRESLDFLVLTGNVTKYLETLKKAEKEERFESCAGMRDALEEYYLKKPLLDKSK